MPNKVIKVKEVKEQFKRDIEGYKRISKIIAKIFDKLKKGKIYCD